MQRFLDRYGASTRVLVLESTLSTFFEVLGGAFKHFSATCTRACACTKAHYSIGAFKHIISTFKHKGRGLNYYGANIRMKGKE